MEDDDEFGELYTDVLLPIAASSPGLRPDPVLPAADDDSGGGDDDRTSSRSVPAAELPSIPQQALAPDAATPAEDDGEGDWMLHRAPPAVDPPDNWDEENDAAPLRPEESSAPYVPGEGEPRVLEDGEEEARVSGLPDGDGNIGEAERFGAPEEDGYPSFGGGVGENLGDLDEAPVIPGLSAGPAPSGPLLGVNIEEGKPSQSEDWDSDSEDDLQIVLNDSNHGPLGAERKDRIGADDDDDDGEEDLVIVTDEDQHHHLPVMEEQEWGDEAMQPPGDGERKEMVDVAKVTGAIGTAPGTRIGHSNHAFHGQHHSMYKYIRPGAAPLPGGPGAVTVGPPGTARPPLVSGPTAGGGRGDWRPAGGRGIPSVPKNYHTGFGFPGWANSSARGSGLDFTLPAHKTVFDIDIESFEEKPWRYPGVDISDFFNFGLDEDKWKDYCKQLDQLRLESTMQSKIRVYESGRSEQEYDPDLPPELAAASGHHNISADNGHGKVDGGEADFTSQGKGPAVMRAPLPTGRAIQVECGYAERLPSIDTRPPRIRDSDVIIEIVLQDSFDDPKMYSCAPEQPEKTVAGDDGKGFYGVEKDDRKTASGYMNHFQHASSNRNKELIRRVPSAKENDEAVPFPSESSAEYHQDSRTRSPVSPAEASGIHQGERLPQGSSYRRCSSPCEQSISSIPSQSAHSSRLGDKKKETLVDSTEVNQSSRVSPAVGDKTGRELSVEERSCEHDEKLMLVDSIEIEGEDMTSDFHISSETGGDDNLVHPGKKQKLCSRVEQSAVHDSGYEDELQISNSDNGREKSGSSKDYPKQTENGDEVTQEGHSNQMGYFKRPHKEDERYLRRKDEYSLSRQEREKNRIVSREREDTPNSCQHLRGKSYERRKESEPSISSWQRREENLNSRRVKDEDMRWENSDEMVSRSKSKLKVIDRNQKDEDHSRKLTADGEWKGHNRDEVLRQRERDNAMMSRRENVDDPLIKRKKDEEYLRGKADKVDTLHGHRDREDSGRRKRERDDGLDHRRREVDTRMRDKVEDNLSSKHKDDNWRYREREDRQRLKPHESAAMHREREEGRGAVRSGRVAEDKPLGGNGRNRDELNTTSYDKDYQEKERKRHNEHSKRGRAREDNVLQNKGRGDISVHEKHSNADERSSRHERLNKYKERHRENTRKAKDAEAQEQNSQGLAKRRHEDLHNAHQNEKVYIKSLNEQESNNISCTTLSKKEPHQIKEHEAPQQHNSMRKQGEADPASDDGNQGSRRGRSKLERWTSHQEREYDSTDNTKTLSASSRAKKIEGDNVDVAQADELAKTGLNNNAGEIDAKGTDGGQVVDKMVDDRDRHLDTVAKLKRRSERFKLPMPSEKEITSNKKLENEVQLPNNEVVIDSEVKPERPARKRRWTGS